MVRIVWTGLDELISMTGQARGDEQFMRTMAMRVRPIADEVLALSQEIVPVRTGALQSSGLVEVEVTPTSARITIGYGGPTIRYARIVHENMNPNVTWTKAGTGPKYLEIPFLRNVSRFERAALEMMVLWARRWRSG